MIVVCPGCAAHYGIDREAFGLNARIVRCSACDYEWEAAVAEFEPADLDQASGLLAETAEGGAVSRPTDDVGHQEDASGDTLFDQVVGAPADAPRSPAAAELEERAWQDTVFPDGGLRSDAPGSNMGGERDTEPDFAPEAVVFSEPGDDSSAASGAASAEEPPPSPDAGYGSPARRRGRLLMAAGGAVALVLAMGVLVVAQGPISSALPGAAAIYSTFGLAPAPLGAGLDIRDVSSSREWSGTADVLVVAGTVANVATGTRGLPALRVTLFDADRSEIQTVVVQPVKTTLAEGESVPFVARIPNPAVAARRVVVSFQIPSAEHGRLRTASAAA
jgi:predicted Zn finger-like uncharacterized protein